VKYENRAALSSPLKGEEEQNRHFVPAARSRRFAIESLLAAFMLLSAARPVYAVTPGEMLPDAGMEARAREISQLLRCVVCQNQSIDDSSAPLAQDLRVLVRERLTSGDTNAQAIQFIVARYGNFVLLKPPVQRNTLLLWFGPALLLALAAFALRRTLAAQAARPQTAEAEPLSADDERRLAALLEAKDKGRRQSAPAGTKQGLS
jgi:cytochrome c-type biogenesis protein CcmH